MSAFSGTIVSAFSVRYLTGVELRSVAPHRVGGQMFVSAVEYYSKHWLSTLASLKQTTKTIPIGQGKELSRSNICKTYSVPRLNVLLDIPTMPSWRRAL